MKKIIKIILVLLISLIIFIGLSTFEQEKSTLKYGKTVIPIEISDSRSERARGLSGRKSLPKKTGMLFVFDKSDQHGFWMKEMNFPIDILWLDTSYRVVDIRNDVSPDTFPTVFTPETKSKFVLELNAGDSARYGIKQGSKLSP